MNIEIKFESLLRNPTLEDLYQCIEFMHSLNILTDIKEQWKAKTIQLIRIKQGWKHKVEYIT